MKWCKVYQIGSHSLYFDLCETGSFQTNGEHILRDFKPVPTVTVPCCNLPRPDYQAG